MNRIEELTALLEQITPGPWRAAWSEVGETLEVTCDARKGMVGIAQIETGFNGGFDAKQKANARFIAAAPEAVRDLLEVVKAAENAIDGTRSCLGADLKALRKALEAFK